MRKKVNMGTNSYKVSVVLLEFEEQIKRTLLINDNVKISDFCEAIIISMNGDLSHRYELKYKNKYYLMKGMTRRRADEVFMGSDRICKLLFDEKDMMLINYDFGDNWMFAVRIEEIIKGHNPKNVVLLDGTGKGIDDDCGGVFGLERLINNKDNDWGYDIDDFNIDKINERFDLRYNKR